MIKLSITELTLGGLIIAAVFMIIGMKAAAVSFDDIDLFDENDPYAEEDPYIEEVTKRDDK